jgi:hypothetical protein
MNMSDGTPAPQGRLALGSDLQQVRSDQDKEYLMSTAAFNRHYRTLGILVGLGLGLLFTGCVSIITTNPADTLQSAVATAKNGSARKAREVMAGSALTVFGAKEGLAAFRDKLSKIVAMDPPRLIAREEGDQGHGHHGDVTRVYSTNVSGLTKEGVPAEYTVQVTCGVVYQEIHLPSESGYASFYPWSHHGIAHSDDVPAYDWEGEVQDCRISQLFAKVP